MRNLLIPALALLFVLAGCADTDTASDATDSAAMADMEAAAGTGEWTTLFEGESADAFPKHGGAATYRIENGTVVGTTAPNSENAFLCTNETFGDFELEFETMVHDSLNSGVQIRSHVRQEDDRVYGPQVEIEAGGAEGTESGYIYGEALDTGWLTPEEELQPHTSFRDGEWNRYRIVAQGPRIQTWINGESIADLTNEEIYADHQEGLICLQVHGIGDAGPWEVSWRNVRVREL
ncbi:MAG: DUF1080 domain-containing protein [Rhodothermales bacterium]